MMFFCFKCMVNVKTINSSCNSLEKEDSVKTVK